MVATRRGALPFDQVVGRPPAMQEQIQEQHLCDDHVRVPKERNGLGYWVSAVFAVMPVIGCRELAVADLPQASW